MLVIVAPGQGSQSPGFLTPWLRHPPYAERLASYGAHLGTDLARLGTAAGPEVLVDTAVAQPLLVAAGLAAARLLLDDRLDDGNGAAAEALVVAGHSVGELTAAALAGVLSDTDALDLAVVRGRAMARAAAARDTGMTAIVGGEPDQVRAVLARHGLEAANVNGAGQLVAAGTCEALDALAEDPPPGARLLPLAVAGAFHTEHMRPAVEEVRRTAAAIEFRDSLVPLVSSRNGSTFTSGAEVRDAVVGQVVAPVRWDQCLQALQACRVTGLLELPPAGTLSALARRGLPGVERCALAGPDRLEPGRTFVRRHLAP